MVNKVQCRRVLLFVATNVEIHKKYSQEIICINQNRSVQRSITLVNAKKPVAEGETENLQICINVFSDAQLQHAVAARARR